MAEAVSMLIIGNPIDTNVTALDRRDALMPGQLATPQVLCTAFSVGVVAAWTRSSITPGDGQDAERGKHHRGRYTDRSHRQLIGDPVRNEDSWNIGEHHAQSGARDNRKELLEPCSKASRGDLRLIADFRDEKGTEIAVNAAERLIDRSLPSYLSRNSAHTATLSSESPSIHRIHGTLSMARKRCRPDRQLHG